MKDYSKLTEVIVKTQEDLDNIPLDFRGRIYIEGGTRVDKIVIKNKYYYRVEARENSSVVAWGNSSVVARENSSVVAWENSSVEARENSSVVAWENSSVEAWENSSVDGNGNSQIVDCLQGAKIKISGNSRIVYYPKNIFEFMDFYGIKHTKTKGIFYKAVHKKKGKYFSDYKKTFYYEVGKTKKEKLNTDTTQDCASGLHIAHLDWALRFGRDWNDLAILEVESKISDIVMPTDTDGKVRTCKLKVLREIPLEECGVFGKILSKRIGK